MTKLLSGRLKLLFITEFFPTDDSLQFSGGVEAHNFYLFKTLARKHQVTVICRWGKNQSKQKKYWGMNIIRIGKKETRIDTKLSTIPNRFFFFIESIYQGLKLDFDLVQGNNFVSYPSAFLLGFIKKKPTIAWYPDVFIGQWIKHTGFLPGVIGEISEKICLMLPWTKVISLSQSTTQKLIKQKVSWEKIRTIYGGVDYQYFSQIKAKKHDVFTICCISRLVSYKRVDLLIKAAAILKQKKCDFKIEIIGEGAEDFSLKLLAHQLKVEDRVTFKSFLSREDLAKQLKAAHLFCLPSEQEGFGLVLIEATSAGLPYVCSDIEVLKEITQNGQGGLFFKKGDAKDLARKISIIAKDKRLQINLSSAAQALAKNYQWESIAKQFQQVYQNLEPKRVVMLVDAWFPLVGGGQIHAWELSKKLANLGLEITIFTRDLGEWNQNYQNIKVIKVGHFKNFGNIVGRIEYLLLATWFCLTKEYDLVHAHAFSPGLLAPIIRKIKNKPVIFTAHGEGFKIAGLPFAGNFLQDLVFYKIYYETEITVAKNTFTKKTRSKTVVIPNGVNIDDWKDSQRKRKEVKNLLFVGRIVADKGVDLLLDAFKKTRGLNLTIVGDGDKLNKFKKYNRSAKIKFRGRLEGEALRAQYKRADLLIMPSRVEGMPLRLLEAWASRLPVIATNVGDNEVYIKEGDNGFLASVDSDSIYQAIERARKADLDQIAENGWRKVQRYTWEDIAEQTLKVYQKFL